MNCLPSFETENKHESHKKLCQKKDFCNVVMPSKDIKKLELSQYRKCCKAHFAIYGDLECFIEKTDGCKNNSENSSAA